MFAAAMMWGAPSVEISIYSTCKRISQKLLRNCVKFFYEVCKQDLAASGFKVVRQNMEEIVLRGPGGERDVRVVNSYPSKVPRAQSRKVKSLPKSLRCAKSGRGATPHSEYSEQLSCQHGLHMFNRENAAGQCGCMLSMPALQRQLGGQHHQEYHIHFAHHDLHTCVYLGQARRACLLGTAAD